MSRRENRSIAPGVLDEDLHDRCGLNGLPRSGVHLAIDPPRPAFDDAAA